MTRFDDKRLFDKLIGGIELTNPQLSSDELPKAWRNGQQLGLNIFEGEDVLSSLRAASDVLLGDLFRLGGAGQDSHDIACEVTGGLEQVLMVEREARDIDEVFALRGLGVFGVPEGDQGDIVPAYLQANRTLFGTVMGVDYGEFWSASPTDIAAHHANDPEDFIVKQVGTVLCMIDVELCHSAQPGCMIAAYDFAAIPIDTSGMNLFRAYAI